MLCMLNVPLHINYPDDNRWSYPATGRCSETLPTTAMLVVTMLQHVLILYLTSSPPTVLVYFRFYYFMPIAFCFNIQVYKVYVAL